MSFKFADSPGFRRALASAVDRAQKLEDDATAMTTGSGSPAAAPNEQQLRIGESGQFADDNALHAAAIDERRDRTLDFRYNFEEMA